MKPLFKKNYFVLLVTTLTLISFSITFAEEPPPKKYELKDAIHILQILAGAGEQQDPEGVIGFDPNGKDMEWIVFDNDDYTQLEFVPNPDRSGENPTATVVKFVAKNAGADHAGVLTRSLDPFKLDETNCTVTILVYKPIKSRVGIKFEQPDGAGGFASTGEIFVTNTKINEWEKLTFDFSSKIEEPSSMNITGLVIFPDFDPRDEDNLCYFDNISFSDDPVIVKVNKVPLEQAIGRANDLANTTGIGTANGQVSQTNANTFRQAIVTAQNVINNPDATQQDVDLALGTLDEAIAKFKNAIIGDIGDDNGDGLIYLYTADDSLIDLDFNEDYQSVNDWGSGSTLDKEYTEDSIYQPVIMVTPGIGSWGDSSNGCVAFSQFSPGFASTYQSLHFKYKGGTLVKLKFPGTKNQEVIYDVNSATQLEDGWFEFTIPLSNHEDYQTASEFGIFNHNIEDPFFITDIYFTPPTESK
jgi:hypothetical protein